MPYYDTQLPAALQTSLEKRIGSHPNYEIIYDPDGSPVELQTIRGVRDVSAINYKRDLDPAYFGRPVHNPIRITLNDPDNYYNPLNENGIFHNVRGEVQATAASGQK